MENFTVSEIFGKRLRHLREKAGLSQSRLAELLRVSRGAISFYENGERCPNIDFLMDVSVLFDVSYDYLLGEAETYNPVERDTLSFLSNQTIDFLRNYGDKQSINTSALLYNWDVLDALLGHKEFKNLMFDLDIFVRKQYEGLRKRVKGEHENGRGDLDVAYAAFRIANHMSRICQDIILNLSYDALTSEEKEQLTQYYSKLYEQFKAFGKEDEDCYEDAPEIWIQQRIHGRTNDSAN